MASSSGTGYYQQQHAYVNHSSFNYGNLVPESSSGLAVNMMHDPGIYWVPEEQATVDYELPKYSPLPNILRYHEISEVLNDKTAMDVALRVKCFNMELPEKENSKKRKDGHNLSRKSKDKKVRVSDPAPKPSQFSARPNVPRYAPAFRGITDSLMEQNAQALSQINANFRSYQTHENLDILTQTRNNMIRILTNMENDSSEERMMVIKKLPLPPAKMDEKLANSILQLTRPQPL